MRGGSRAPGARIGSSAPIVNVKTWDPAQDEEEVQHGQSVIANLEAINTGELEVLYDAGADWNTGTHDDTEAIGDDLQLVTSPFIEDWEGVTPLNDWTNRLTSGNWSVIDDGTGNKVAQYYVYNNQSLRSADNGPNASNVQVRARFQLKSLWDGYLWLGARLTGSGSALRGYCLNYEENNDNMRLSRFTGDGSLFNLGFSASVLGGQMPIDTWYWMAYLVTGTGHYFKIWLDGAAEPGSWTWIATDGTHAGPGDVGVGGRHSTANEFMWTDDFRAEAIPPTYVTSGDWESGIVDVSAVEHYSHGYVSWDETIPANTTLAVKYRWRDIDSWAALTNGAILPGIALGDDMQAGSTKSELEFRVELATTDDSVTPVLTNLRVYFEPLRVGDLELTVHGDALTIANGLLRQWGRGWIGSSGNPPTIEADWSDIFVASDNEWIARDRQTVTAALEYWGNAIDSVTFVTEASKYRHGYLRSYWSVPSTPFYTGANVFEYTTLKEWFPMGHSFEWHMIDKGQAIHGDARWLVGHIQLDSQPGSFLAGLLQLENQPGSMLVEGDRLDTTPGMALVQGWRRDSQPGMVMPAEPFLYTTPGSLLVAVTELSTQPGSYLVYGVNREGSIFVTVIDDDAYQTLLDHGVTFS